MELNALSNFSMGGINKWLKVPGIVAIISITVLCGVVVGIFVGKTYLSFKRHRTAPAIHLTVGSSLPGQVAIERSC